MLITKKLHISIKISQVNIYSIEDRYSIPFTSEFLVMLITVNKKGDLLRLDCKFMKS